MRTGSSLKVQETASGTGQPELLMANAPVCAVGVMVDEYPRNLTLTDIRHRAPKRANDSLTPAAWRVS
jgi:hypothetical protein